MSARETSPDLLPSKTPPDSSVFDRRTLLKRWRSQLLWIVPLVILVLVAWGWSLTAQRRAIRSMDPQERSLLFQETLESFHRLCGKQTKPGLVDYCGGQARFLAHFPECGPECRQQTGYFLRSTR